MNTREREHAFRYARSGHRSVQGWLTREAALSIVQLAAVQELTNIRGGAAEIGVHHGRLLVLLAMLLRNDEHAIGVDLFEQQSENIDRSGQGSMDRVVAHLRRYDIESRVTLLSENSMRLTPARVLQMTGPIRLFSVDGGHTEEITYNDLSLASETLCDGGLLILDDYLNQQWPSVTEGACRFMRTRPLNVVGFVSNKLILCKGPADQYRSAINGKRVEMFGQPAVFFRELSVKERLARSSLWQSMRSGAIGRFARMLSH